MIAHLYVHAPFCARRCVYCDFAVTVDRAPAAAPWLTAIGREFETLRATGDLPMAPKLDTLYVGGGTPSLLDPRAVGQLLAVLGRGGRNVSPISPSEELEWTVEANPESFTASVAQEWASSGVNRISFGVQSFDPGALEWMGRLHTPSDAEAAVARARAAGVDNYSLDLIFGLPDTVSRSWETDLRRALDLSPPHLSLYGLTVEDGTRLFRDVAAGRTPSPSGARYREEYLQAAELLAAAGYEHYEVSNFALPGLASRHNRAYWSGASYLGLGNGAHSFHDGQRWWNEREWEAYADMVVERGHGRAGQERASREQSRLESIWLGLRTAQGLNVAGSGELDCRGRPGEWGQQAERDRQADRDRRTDRLARKWEARGLAVCDENAVRLTPSGWLLLDELAVEMDLALKDGGEAATQLTPSPPPGHTCQAPTAMSGGRAQR